MVYSSDRADTPVHATSPSCHTTCGSFLPVQRTYYQSRRPEFQMAACHIPDWCFGGRAVATLPIPLCMIQATSQLITSLLHTTTSVCPFQESTCCHVFARGPGHPGKIPGTSQVPSLGTQGKQTFKGGRGIFGPHPFA